MSHGSGAPEEAVEINMIPMIDIVIQLITFFLMLVDFGNNNSDERVRLPLADLAKPEASNVEEALILNIDRTGEVKLVGEVFDADSVALRTHLQREASAALLSMRLHGEEPEMVGTRAKLWTTVLIRADKEVEYGKIQRLIRSCQDLGFYKFALRATPNEASM